MNQPDASTSPGALPSVVHHPEQQRFDLWVDGLHCVADYRLDRVGGCVVFTHTGVPGALRGRGIAAELIRVALDWARAERLRVVPACSYVEVYMRRHPDTLTLLQAPA